MADLKLFLQYLSIVYIAFTLALFGYGRAGMHSFSENVFTFNGASAITNWGMFGYVDPYRIESPTAIVLVVLYMLFVHIALMNLLVAMFTDTYRRIHNNAEGAFTPHPKPPAVPTATWRSTSTRHGSARAALSSHVACCPLCRPRLTVH